MRAAGRTGVVFPTSPEAEAFARWQKEQFEEVERRFASEWRIALTPIDRDQAKALLARLGISYEACKSLQDAYAMARSIVKRTDRSIDRMKLAVDFIKIPPRWQQSVLARWIQMGYPALHRYAPYAAHVLTVELLMHISVSKGLIAPERASNRTDIAYLFYVPFCTLFISSDNLHRRIAPLFLRADQEFIWGDDVKRELTIINEENNALSEDIKSVGVLGMSSRPPDGRDSLIQRIWDRHAPNWRNSQESSTPRRDDVASLKLEEMKALTKAPAIPLDEVDFDVADSETLSVQRMVPKKKGSWWLLPKDFDPAS